MSEREKGETGATGASGASGATGAGGATGATGGPGARGKTGGTGASGEKGVRGERGRRGGLPRMAALSFLVESVVIAAVLGLFVWVDHQNRGLIGENKRRVAEIQESRVSSCRQTYEGVRDVLLSFFPEKGRTAQQQDDLDKLNRTVDGLKKRCVRQTRPLIEKD